MTPLMSSFLQAGECGSGCTGVDTPESGEPFSDVSRRFTRVSVLSRDVVLVGRDVDRYNRLVARVLVDGSDLSAQLLSAGLACHYRRFSDDPVLETAERSDGEHQRRASGIQTPSVPAASGANRLESAADNS